MKLEGPVIAVRPYTHADHYRRSLLRHQQRPSSASAPKPDSPRRRPYACIGTCPAEVARRGAALLLQMSEDIQRSLAASLAQVTREREIRACDDALKPRSTPSRRSQHASASCTPARTCRQCPLRKAVRFFVTDLYGPMDFTRRDAEFARVAPELLASFPRELSKTVARHISPSCTAPERTPRLAKWRDTSGSRQDAAAGRRLRPRRRRLAGQPTERRRRVDLAPRPPEGP